MANKEHLGIFEQGIEVWNKWREQSPEIRPDLSKARPGRANLRRADLHGTNLGRANLRRADLQGANLSGANLIEAELRGADLRGVDLRAVKGLDQVQINEARGDKYTQLPEGPQRPAGWLGEPESE